MQLIKKIIVAALLALPLNLLAHGYWIELEGPHTINEAATVKLIFGDYHLAEKLAGDKLDRMKDIRVFVLAPDGNKQPITMTQLADCWQGQFTPAAAGVYTIIGVNDEREVQDWTKHGLGITRPVQYLKAVYEIGTVKKTAASDILLNMTVQETTTNVYTLYLTRNGEPADTCYVTIVDPDGNEEEVKTNPAGKAEVSVKKTGLYLLSVEWIDKTPGVFRDKEYKTTRHRLDYSLYTR